LALTPGTRLGVYEIVAHIGEGGMGAVYRARDTKLNREVALKVLPDAFASDADRLARFTREAQTLASLNHPNIAHIHGLEESGGVRALVMELVEGDDLSQRIARGAIPVDEALPIAKQIAEGLEAAHQQGIIHRDLKPANIKLRPDGAVKILDFGLAKALAPEQGPASATHQSLSPTITSPAMLTAAGIVLGTAAYMAPEQAKGREADKRSDIWAFGCVLYEMLTGRRPFDGEDMTDVLGAVVRLEPAWEALPSDVPVPVRTLLRQCLVKDRRQRVGDIAAVLFVLDHQASLAPARTVAPRSTRVVWLVAALSAIALIATAVVALRMSRSGAPASDPVQFTIAPPENTSFGGRAAGGTGTIAQLAVSPDGRNIAFVAGAQSEFQLWLRPVASADARAIQGTEGAAFPFWSHDSRFIAFFAGGKLKKVAIAGGPPIVVADAAAAVGGSWSRDNVIVFGSVRSGVFSVPSAGGVPAAVTALADGESAHRWPHFLPDGRHFFYTGVTGGCCPPAKPGTIKIGSLDRDEPAVALLHADSSASYSSNHVLFARDQTLMAQAFDPDARQLAGDAVPVIERISTEGSRYVSVSVSENGTLVYAPGGSLSPLQLTWFDRAGKTLGTLGEGGVDINLSLSPNERQVALALRSGSPENLDIWTIDIARNLRNRVTSDAQPEGWPVWSPDGTRIVFGSGARGEGLPEKARLVQTLVNATGPNETLLEAVDTPSRPCGPRQCVLAPSDWSADGRFVLYTFSGSFPQTMDIWALPLFGERKPFPVIHTEFTEAQGTFSRDSRWIAYTTDETGQANVYVQPFLRAGGKYRISPNGGRNPHWRADGRELFYLDANGTMTAVPIDATDTFELPKALFPTGLVSTNNMYAVTRDGQRFLVDAGPLALGLAQRPQITPLTVIVNWTSTLQK
jgi:Tol biopolymer transport system component/tRNA A-37 threonylcarbamoyl transferase component Bud32